MAVGVARPGFGARVGAFVRGIPAGYRNVVAEMRRVTWPDVTQVRQATISIIIFVLILGLLITILDFALQGILIRGIPSLFAGR